MTGLPGSGKTTVAEAFAALCDACGLPTVVLDGDVVRPLIAADVGRTAAERFKSLERYLALCSLLLRSRILVVVAVINHAEQQRQHVRRTIGKQYCEVWLQTPLEVCQQRDPKGLYRKALSGAARDMVGVSIAYEVPQHPEVCIDTLKLSPDKAARKIFRHLEAEHIVVRCRD